MRSGGSDAAASCCREETQERRPLLTAAIRERLWPYLGGIARENDMKALAIGGLADHVHLLLSLPATLSVSKAMQLLKGNSSKWLRETFAELRQDGFAWQEGFGGFSIGVSGVEGTIEYIRTKSFGEELEVFLKKHGFDYAAGMLDWGSSVPAGTWFVFRNGYPALKRWAIFGNSEPTKAMGTEAVAAGFCESASGKKYPRLQFLTIETQ